MSSSRHLAIWSGAILAIGSASADPYPRNADLDMIGYRYELALSESSDQIRMEAGIEFRFLAAGRTRVLVDLVGRGDSGRGMVVDQVTDAGERSRLSIRYHGVPAAALKIGPNKSGQRTFSSDNWPDLARHWLVGVDHPYDKATSEFIVTAPAHAKWCRTASWSRKRTWPGDSAEPIGDNPCRSPPGSRRWVSRGTRSSTRAPSTERRLRRG
jgi:hypothetical protein